MPQNNTLEAELLSRASSIGPPQVPKGEWKLGMMAGPPLSGSVGATGMKFIDDLLNGGPYKPQPMDYVNHLGRTTTAGVAGWGLRHARDGYEKVTGDKLPRNYHQIIPWLMTNKPLEP